MGNAIEFENVSFSYQKKETKALDAVSFSIKEGECILLTGKSGSGKSSVLQAINGLIPHFFTGEFTGSINVLGESIQGKSVQELSKTIGSVFQNPKSQFFNLDAEDELSFTPSNHNVSIEEIEKRKKDSISKFQLEKILNRKLLTLSSGEMQKIACASVYMNLPKIYLLDEPSANLDTIGIEQLKQTLQEIKKLGATILIAEHRIYYALEICDKIFYMNDGILEKQCTKTDFLALPQESITQMGLRSVVLPQLEKQKIEISENSIEVKNLFCERKGKTILDIKNLSIPKGHIIAITGENGVGKTTFVKSFCGVIKSNSLIHDEKKLAPKERIKRSFLVMQDVNSQLSCETVFDELVEDETPENSKKALKILESLNLLEKKDEHPFALSGGQKQRVAIGTALFLDKKYMFFDEPTSGLDYESMVRVSHLLKELVKTTELIAVITHDREFIQHCCDYEINFSRSNSADIYKIGEKN